MLILLSILTLLFLQYNEQVEALSCYGGDGWVPSFNNLTLGPCRPSFPSCVKRTEFASPDRVFRACHPNKNCNYAAKEKSEYVSEHYFIGNMICTNATEWPREDPSRKYVIQECCCEGDGCNL
ncbi:hypothetical protein DdX_20874 [Ditylenchus destructor]|uniref:Uncharacterized protein n=1 Tax=Ditylenchus destructor TaxID=166010 RepID=A0AAD4MK04_9BILA|nr:hypothetical protein DdX_20874 [Ditylenchus destructor]